MWVFICNFDTQKERSFFVDGFFVTKRPRSFGCEEAGELFGWGQSRYCSRISMSLVRSTAFTLPSPSTSPFRPLMLKGMVAVSESMKPSFLAYTLTADLTKISGNPFAYWDSRKIRAIRLAGCLDGFEPSTFGTTIRHSNQLNYRHHFGFAGAKVYKFFQTAKHFGVFFCKKVIPSGFEPETHSLEGFTL